MLGSNQVPLNYTVPVPGTLTALSASAVFDGGGAATFVPCLSFYDSDGNLLARATAPTVAAGASAEVSWFPRVSQPASGGGGGIQFDTDNEGGWLYVQANDSFEAPNIGTAGIAIEDVTAEGAYLSSIDGAGPPQSVIGVTPSEIDLTAGIGGTPVGLGLGSSAAQFTIASVPILTLSDDGTIDVEGNRLVNGADGIDPTDFATVGQLTPATPLTVEDGMTTVSPVTTINFTTGAVVTDAGGGEADIAISPAGSGIAFDTTNSGDWLDIQTNGEDGAGYGVQIVDQTSTNGILIATDAASVTAQSSLGDVVLQADAAQVHLTSSLTEVAVGTGIGIQGNLGTGESFTLYDHNGSLLLEVTEDGTYHIRTGATWVADL